MAITLSSSADIVSFPKPKQRFAATSKSWLSQQLADERLTHGDKLLASILYLYIDRKHWEATEQLLAYPGWERLQEETTLSKSSLDRGLKKFESVSAIKIIHGGFDPKTGQRRPNQYLLIPSDQNKNQTHQVTPMAPGNPATRCHPRHLDQVSKPGVKSDAHQVSKPGVTSDTITGEVTGEVEPVNINKKLDSNFDSEGSEERGLAREEGRPRVLPSATTSPSPSLNGPAGNGGGAVFIKYDTREAGLYERFMGRATGKPFPRSGRLSGFYVSSTEQEAVLKLAAAEGAL